MLTLRTIYHLVDPSGYMKTTSGEASSQIPALAPSTLCFWCRTIDTDRVLSMQNGQEREQVDTSESWWAGVGHNNHSNPTVLNLLSLLLGFPETISLFQSGETRLLLDIPFHKDCTQNMEIRQRWWFCHPPCLLGMHRCWRNLFHKTCEVICSHTKVRGYVRQFDSLNHGFVWCAPVLGEVQQLHAAPTALAVPQSPK